MSHYDIKLHERRRNRDNLFKGTGDNMSSLQTSDGFDQTFNAGTAGGSIRIYWDDSDPQNVGLAWHYTTDDNDDYDESGSIDTLSDLIGVLDTFGAIEGRD